MSQSSAYGGGGGGGSSNYSYATSSGQSSNYNYLSFFATGSFGRRLEGQRSRDPTAPGNLAEEKRRWKWIAGAAIAFMFLMNIVAAIGLSWLKYQTYIDEAGFEGDLQEFIHHEMKNLRRNCQPRYRKTQECSQVSAQIVLVANSDKDTVVWRAENSSFAGYNQTTPGAFVCKGVEFDASVGRLRVLSDGVYQIHSHASVHKMVESGEKFQHEIRHNRFHWGKEDTVAEETFNRTCSTASNHETCFSSSLLATEYLEKNDLIHVRFQVNGKDVSPTKENFLVPDGRSTYFGIVKLGVINR